MGLTVGDEQEHEGFVPPQVEDGLLVGVIFRRGVWEDGLGVAGRDGRTVPDDCAKTHLQVTEPQTQPWCFSDVPTAVSKNRPVDTAAQPKNISLMF